MIGHFAGRKCGSSHRLGVSPTFVRFGCAAAFVLVRSTACVDFGRGPAGDGEIVARFILLLPRDAPSLNGFKQVPFLPAGSFGRQCTSRARVGQIHPNRTIESGGVHVGLVCPSGSVSRLRAAEANPVRGATPVRRLPMGPVWVAVQGATLRSEIDGRRTRTECSGHAPTVLGFEAGFLDGLHDELRHHASCYNIKTTHFTR